MLKKLKTFCDNQKFDSDQEGYIKKEQSKNNEKTY